MGASMVIEEFKKVQTDSQWLYTYIYELVVVMNPTHTVLDRIKYALGVFNTIRPSLDVWIAVLVPINLEFLP